MGVPIIGCKCSACQSDDPRDRRLRTSAFVEHQGDRILIDVGPDFRQQFIDNAIDTVDAILLTHEHHDHVGGIDDIRPINFLHRKIVPVYGYPRVLREIKTRFKYAFQDEKYPGTPKLELHAIEAQVTLPNTRIRVVPVWHGQLRIAAFRIGGFAYITDANAIDDEVIAQLQDLDILIINALRQKRHYSHFSLGETLDQVRLLNPRSAYLTHISHDMGPTRSWEGNLPSNVYPSYDGLVLNL